MTATIFVTGGVSSSLGKGLHAASLGLLLKASGLRVTILKIDPYLNVDPGTMSPFQHGEVFVLDDGAETDLDLGHYERFLDVNLGRANSVTMGQIYSRILAAERRGDYLGNTVQTIPHVTDAIKKTIRNLHGPDMDCLIVEVGGTTGDIEGLPVMEAIRQLSLEIPAGEKLFVHLTLLPYLSAANEVKTKPTQHSVITLRSAGIQPDIIICRSEGCSLSDDDRSKIGMFCNIPPSAVIESPTLDSVYRVPQYLLGASLWQEVCTRLGHPAWATCHPRPELESWTKFVESLDGREKESVRIGVVGKYSRHQDAYKSIHEALIHAGAAAGIHVQWLTIDAEDYDTIKIVEHHDRDDLSDRLFPYVDGILVPGGFGNRGVEGKINIIHWSRENKIPFFGICLGMQCAVIEYARSVLQLPLAHSTEFQPDTPHPVVSIMEQRKEDKGGTLRLGGYNCTIQARTRLAAAYSTDDQHEVNIRERHRHRYEVSRDYVRALRTSGLILSGIEPGEMLVEAIEWPNHPWGVAVQFHPELQSRPLSPHPLFLAFIRAACAHKQMAPQEPTKED